MSKGRALIRVMKGYLEIDRIEKMDSRFVDFVHSHTSTVREVQDIIGEDSAAKWLPFLSNSAGTTFITLQSQRKAWSSGK